MTRLLNVLERWHRRRTDRANAKYYPKTSGAVVARRKP